MSSFRVCVFGSSSKQTNSVFVHESRRLGEELAKRGMLCVNGGGRWGCMGGLNDGCEAHNGAVRGVIHEMFCVDSQEHPHISDMIKVNGADLWERKQLLLDHGDCVIVLPGGVGTFDELWESVSGKSLGMKGMEGKPVCVVNTDGFYDGFVMQLQRAFDEGILYGSLESYFHVETDPIAALDWCVETVKAQGNVKSKPLSDVDTRMNKREESTFTVKATPTSVVITPAKFDYFKGMTIFAVGIVIGAVVSRAALGRA